MSRHRDGDRRVDAGQLLDRDGIRESVAAAAFVLLRNRDAHEPQLGKLGDDVVGKAMLAVELLRDRRDAPLREIAHGAAEQLVLFGKIEIHEERRPASSVSNRTPYPVAPPQS